MEYQGTWSIGIEVEGKFYREFTLEEERFRHTLDVYTDMAISREALNDPAYEAAAVLAKRLIVPGIDRKGLDEKKMEVVLAVGKGVTPEMVLDLFPEDGIALGRADADITKRRSDFRSAAAGKGSTGD